MSKPPNDWYSIRGFINPTRWNTNRTPVVTEVIIYLNNIATKNPNTNTWTMTSHQTILSNQKLIISSGQTLETGSYTLTVYGTIMNNGTIINQSAHTIVNNAEIINNYIITNQNGGVITNNKTITNNNGGTITILGNSTFTNNGGNIKNQSGATIINNGGSINNKKSATITNNGGTIINQNGASFTNYSGGIINNTSGTITNSSGVTYANNGTLNGTQPTTGPTDTINPVTPTLSNFTIESKDFGSGSFTITDPTSISNGSFSYSSDNTSVATISESTVTIVNAGNTTITATQAAAGNFTAGSATAVLTVSPSTSGEATILEYRNNKGTSVNWNGVNFNNLPNSNSYSAIIVDIPEAKWTYSNIWSLGPQIPFKSDLTKVVFGSTTKTIGSYSFYECTALTSVTFSESITRIGSYAFSRSGLISVTLPNSTTVDGNIFERCSELTSVTLGNSITSITTHMFYLCTKLTSITIPNSVTTIAVNALRDTGLTSVIIPNSVTSMGDGCFTNCRALKSLTIGNSLVSVGTYAFRLCTALTSVTILGSSLTSIGRNAFEECTALPSFTIPNTVTRIDTYAFYKCTSLISITIPSSVTIIEANAFQLSGLNSVTISGQAAYALNLTPNGNVFFGATSVSFTYVNPIAPTITGFNMPAKFLGNAPFNITAPTSNSSGSFTYTSSNTDVATISGSTVTILTAGTTTITATQAGAGFYTQGSTTAVLTVEDLSIYNVTNLEWGSGNQSLRASTKTNLLAQYDATKRSGYTLQNLTDYPSQVIKWNDLTGNGYHLEVNTLSSFSAGPTVAVNSNINGLTAFDFALNRGFISDGYVPLADAITIFMVIKNKGDSLTSYGNFMHHGNRDTDWSIEREGMSAFVKFESGNNNNVGLNLTGNTNYILIGRLSKNPTKREFWKYSDADTAGFSSATTAVQISPSLFKALFVGKSDSSGLESCNSLIGEIIYYNAAISDEDIESNRQYLQKRWLERSSLSKYEKNVSFTMAVKPSNATYKYRYELISNNVVIKTSAIDWVSNQTTTISNDNLNFSTLYTYKVSLVDSDNTQVLTPGVISGSFTTPAQS